METGFFVVMWKGGGAPLYMFIRRKWVDGGTRREENGVWLYGRADATPFLSSEDAWATWERVCGGKRELYDVVPRDE